MLTECKGALTEMGSIGSEGERDREQVVQEMPVVPSMILDRHHHHHDLARSDASGGLEEEEVRACSMVRARRAMVMRNALLPLLASATRLMQAEAVAARRRKTVAVVTATALNQAKAAPMDRSKSASVSISVTLAR